MAHNIYKDNEMNKNNCHIRIILLIQKVESKAMRETEKNDWRVAKGTGKPGRVLIPFERYGRPNKSAQIIFSQHFSEVVLVLLILFSK